MGTGRLYSATEAASRLGVTPETVKAYCRVGKLAAKKVGPRQQWFVPAAEIARLRREWGMGALGRGGV